MKVERIAKLESRAPQYLAQVVMLTIGAIGNAAVFGSMALSGKHYYWFAGAITAVGMVVFSCASSVCVARYIVSRMLLDFYGDDYA